MTSARLRSLAVLLGSATLLSPAVGRASAWIEPFGALRLGASYSGIRADRQFAAGDAPGFTGPLCPDPIGPGERMPYSCVTGGVYQAHGIHLDVSAGIAPFASIDLSVPILVHAQFEDDLGKTPVRGLGDIRLALRNGGVVDGWALAGVLGLTAPTGPPGLEDREVPLGEGQWDIELGVRVGRSLWPWGWVELHNTLRIRLPHDGVSIDKGEEWTGSLSGGFTPVRWVAITGSLEWIVAGPDTDAFGLHPPGRKMLQFRPGLLVMPHEDFVVSANVAIPIAGERWPAGPSWTVGVSGRIRFRKDAPAEGEGEEPAS